MNQHHKTILVVGFILMATKFTFAMYDPHTGRFMQQDPIGTQPADDANIKPFKPELQHTDGANIYQYVLSNPVGSQDSMGLNLYAIGGTLEDFGDNANVEKVYMAYQRDAGPKVGTVKYYWDGPDDVRTGDDSADISGGVRLKICQDYCKNRKVSINLCGWSRGGAIAAHAAQTLGSVGCFCCDKGRYSWHKPVLVNWIGLFDAVRMTDSISKPTILSGGRISHAIKTTIKEPWFPTMHIKGGNVVEHYFYNKDGSATSHNDIGTGKLALDWIMAQGKAKGLIFK